MISAKLLGVTCLNPVLMTNVGGVVSDLATLRQAQSTPQEALIEYAGRVCYRSTARMGTAPEFISARVREGHEDIIEHVHVAMQIENDSENFPNLYCGHFLAYQKVKLWARRSRWRISGNLRAWRAVQPSAFFGSQALGILKGIAPSVFAEFDADTILSPDADERLNRTGLAPMADGKMTVALLGWMNLPHSMPHGWGSATFLIDGISRACTHQLVRHRLASFSQESQRYVDLDKGKWGAIVPPAIAQKPEAATIMADAWRNLEDAYRKMRDLGIRKEDARFLLPNATETRIVVTMNFDAWRHFLWQRALDKAAQWEIRTMGQKILELLYAIAPQAFQQEWNQLQEMNR